jgi:hypothetical protein
VVYVEYFICVFESINIALKKYRVEYASVSLRYTAICIQQSL